MADHRSFGRPPHPASYRGALPREAPEHFDPDPFFPERRGVPAPPAKLRGRLLVAALAVGACAGAALSGDQVAHSGPGAPPAAVQQLPR